MIRIAIIDDDKSFSEALAPVLRSCISELEKELSLDTIDVEVICYSSPDEVVIDVKKRVDMYFIDYCLEKEGGMTGFHVAQRIREESTKCEIAFITADESVMSQAFPFKPLGFIVKPPEKKCVKDVLRSYFMFHSVNDRIDLSTKKCAMVVELNDIVYLDADGRNTTVKLASGEKVTVPTRKVNFTKINLARSFCRIHRSTVVNLDYVDYIDRSFSKIVTKTNDTLFIAQQKTAEVAEKYTKYTLC